MSQSKLTHNVHEHFYVSSISLSELMGRVTEIAEVYPTSGEFVILTEDHSNDLMLVYQREETDAEYAKRLKEQEKVARVKMDRKAQQEAKERALFEELRKKYGDS
jgi:L-alanine-DL-glutamate epimerase-like enolase superfamily enzyme